MAGRKRVWQSTESNIPEGGAGGASQSKSMNLYTSVRASSTLV